MESLNVIYSLWTKPYRELGNTLGFDSIEDFVNSLILSVNVSKQHYNNIHFYTDKTGMEIIKPYMDQLPFTEIYVILDEADWVPSQWWAFPKIYVYSLQKEPFIHLDNDAYLWDKLKEEMSTYDFISQNLESVHDKSHKYYKDAIRVYADHILHIDDIKDTQRFAYAMNAGIFGAFNNKGLKLFKNMYDNAIKVAKSAMADKWLMDFINWKDLRNWDAFLFNTLNEQHYAYYYCINNNLRHLELLDTKLQFTHLISNAKRNKDRMDKIKKRIVEKNWKSAKAEVKANQLR